MTRNSLKRLSPRLLLVPTVAMMLIALVPAIAHAGTPDQRQTNFAGDAFEIYNRSEGTDSLAQTFTAGQSGALDQVDVVIQAYGGITAPLTVEITDVPVAGGQPGTTVLASATVPAASIPPNPGSNPSFVPVTFITPATVTAGTQYAIVASLSTLANFNYDGWYIGEGGDLYRGGAAYAYTPDRGWTYLYASTSDFAFKTYVIPAADTTPPTLSLPSPVTVDATSPTGAVVNYTASASDNQDPNPTVTCAPASGSTFPIGTTTVNCTATDAAGNSRPGSFTVTVNGAPQQVANQIAVIQGFGLPKGSETSFISKFQSAQSAMQADDTATACDALTSASNSAHAQSGKKLTVAQANEIIAAAQQIASVFGC